MPASKKAFIVYCVCAIVLLGSLTPISVWLTVSSRKDSFTLKTWERTIEGNYCFQRYKHSFLSPQGKNVVRDFLLVETWIKKNWWMTLKIHQKKIMCEEPCRHIQIILPKSLQIWNGGKHHCKHQQDVHHLRTERWGSTDGSPGAQDWLCSPRSSGGCCTIGVTRRGREAAGASCWGHGWRASEELVTAFEMNWSIFLKNAHGRATNMKKV